MGHIYLAPAQSVCYNTSFIILKINVLQYTVNLTGTIVTHSGFKKEKRGMNYSDVFISNIYFIATICPIFNSNII